MEATVNPRTLCRGAIACSSTGLQSYLQATLETRLSACFQNTASEAGFSEQSAAWAGESNKLDEAAYLEMLHDDLHSAPESGLSLLLRDQTEARSRVF